MDNKKKTLAENKKQNIKVKKSKTKNKQKQKQKQEQSNKQTIKLNISTSGGSGGGSTGGIQPYRFPSQQPYQEQTTLLKSINEQLKTNNKPISSNQMFNIPEVKQPEQQRQPTEIFNIPEVNEPEQRQPTEIFNIPEVNKPKVMKNKVPEVNLSLMEQIKQAGEKKQLQPIEPSVKFDFQKPPLPTDFKQALMDKIKEKEDRLQSETQQFTPIVDKPIDKTNMSMIDLIQEKALERKSKKIDTEEMEQKIAEENKKDFDRPSLFKQELIRKVKEKEEQKEKEKEIPIVNVPEDKSNLGLLEQISDKLKEIPEDEEKMSVFEENERRFRKKKQSEEEKELNRLEKQSKRLEKERDDRLKEEQKIIDDNLKQQKQNKKQESENKKQEIADRGFKALLNNSTPDQQNIFRASYNAGFLPKSRIRELLLNVRVNPDNDKSKKKFTRDEVNRFFSGDL
jgi:hypothetical protein